MARTCKTSKIYGLQLSLEIYNALISSKILHVHEKNLIQYIFLLWEGYPQSPKKKLTSVWKFWVITAPADVLQLHKLLASASHASKYRQVNH